MAPGMPQPAGQQVHPLICQTVPYNVRLHAFEPLFAMRAGPALQEAS